MLQKVWGGIDALFFHATHGRVITRAISSLTLLAVFPVFSVRMASYWHNGRWGSVDRRLTSANAIEGKEKNDAEKSVEEQNDTTNIITSPLFKRRWANDRTAGRLGRVFIIHGYGEHSGRYEHVAKELTRRGFDVEACDLPGHGLSSANSAEPDSRPECYYDSYETVLDEIEKHMLSIISSDRDVNCKNFILGHSMGGGLSILLTRRINSSPRGTVVSQMSINSGIHSDGVEMPHPLISGVCLSGPAIVPDPDVAKPILVAISGVISRHLPRLPVIKLPATAVSRDPKVVENYLNDRLVYSGAIRARIGDEILKMMEDVISGAETDDFPFFVMHGSKDKLARLEGSVLYEEKSAAKDKSIEILDGLFHEIMNEPEGPSVIAKFADWFEKRA